MAHRLLTLALAATALTAAAPSLPSKAQSAETAPQAGPFPLSVMLWTVFTELPFEQRLAKIAEAGYSNVELVGEYSKWSAADFARANAARKRLGIEFDATAGLAHGIANPGLLSSYGYAFSDAVPDTASYQVLPKGELLGPGDGALVKSPSSPTVYLVSGRARHGFTSIAVFRSLGFKTASVLTVPAAQLDALPDGNAISDKTAGHLPGVNVSSKGTVYFLGDTARLPYPSLAVFNTWNLPGDFSRVVPANAADMALPIGSAITARPDCTSQ